jgi:hypothetical protein
MKFKKKKAIQKRTKTKERAIKRKQIKVDKK